MIYPSMGHQHTYRVNLPELNGGINRSLPPHLIADNQLADVCNMWYKDGRLQTRAGFAVLKDSCSISAAEYTRTAKVGDRLLVYTLNDAFFDGTIFDDQGAYEATVDIPKEGLISVLPITVNGERDVALVDCAFLLLAFFKNGATKIYGYKAETKALVEIEPYVPTIMKGGVPSEDVYSKANGTNFEPKNLLSRKYKCQYTTDGVGWRFVLPETLEGAVKISAVYENDNGDYIEHLVTPEEDETVCKESEDQGDHIFLRVDIVHGEIFFDEPSQDAGNPLKAKTFEEAKRANNVTITVEKAPEDHLSGMRFSTWFGGGSSGLSGGTRLFLGGDSKDPSLIVWSSLNNPLYFPATNYAYVGDSDTPVTAFSKQSDMLVVFKENETFCLRYAQGYTPTAEQLEAQEAIDVESAQALFPMYPIHPEIGCDCPGTICLCDNRLVWLNSDGRVYALFSNGQFNENNVRELSKTIEPLLRGYDKDVLRAACAEKEGDHYFLLIEGRMYVMDFSSNGFSYYASYSSDEKAQRMIAWYPWDLTRDGVYLTKEQYKSLAPRLFKSGSRLFLAAEAVNAYGSIHVYMLEMTGDVDTSLDGEKAIACFFQTKQFDFGHPERYKRVNPFYLQITGEEGKRLNLTYLNGNRGCLDDCAPMMMGEELENCTPMRITPNAVRVRDFGFCISSEGRMEVGSLTLNYAMMGTVR